LYETIRSEKGAGVAAIYLNRPDELNAFDGRMHG
jgi:enoyl-CoA hydratase/carnithine racemase